MASHRLALRPPLAVLRRHPEGEAVGCRVDEAAGGDIVFHCVRHDGRCGKTWRRLQEYVDELDLSETLDSQDDEDYYDDESDESRVFLEEIEENILELVAKCELRKGWGRPNVDEVCSFMQDNQIRIRHYLDRLVEAGLLRRHLNTVSPTTYSATAKGRAYLVDNDLV